MWWVSVCVPFLTRSQRLYPIWIIPRSTMWPICFIPDLVILDTEIPADAMKSFHALQGEHQVRRQITDERIATAWIGKNVIYGGEITKYARVDAPANSIRLRRSGRCQGAR